MKRIFVAVKVNSSPQLIQVFNQIKLELKRDKINWVDSRNIHVTLKFIGETHESRIPEIVTVLEEVGRNHSPFEFELKNIGLFGSSYNPRVLWMGIQKASSLIELANDVLECMDGIGFVRDRQNFVPHLTLGRIKRIDHKNHFQSIIDKYRHFDIQVQIVRSFYLIESVLRPSGPEYKILHTFDLK
ncbi:MAG: RNA 2',3'-cyclic phosphodiesterase [Bacteroidales bacterium]